MKVISRNQLQGCRHRSILQAHRLNPLIHRSIVEHSSTKINDSSTSSNIQPDSTSKNLQMEATWEANISSLLDKIKPPLLEDAGLEDCALPSDSIQEAFPKAAMLSAHIFSTTPVMNQKEIASMIYGLETNQIDSSDLQTINLIV
ncbi:hypothetical protein Lser_V15G20018 [Lactuca serriola]